MFKSKKCFTIALFFLSWSIIFISGCSNNDERRFGGVPDLSPEELQNSPEELQKRMEQRRESMIQLCTDKMAGDTCIIETPRGNQNGTCTDEEGVLLCTGKNFGERGGPPWEQMQDSKIK